jgi:hypothetical protein
VLTLLQAQVTWLPQVLTWLPQVPWVQKQALNYQVLIWKNQVLRHLLLH